MFEDYIQFLILKGLCPGPLSSDVSFPRVLEETSRRRVWVSVPGHALWKYVGQ